MRSDAKQVAEYLDNLPPERRGALIRVRQVILENIQEGFEEVMNWGMIAWQVPLAVYPDTYNGQPLLYAALASQKNHMAVYLTVIYSDEATREKFEADYKATGKRLDAGKSCVRFKKVDDLPLELIGKVIASLSMEKFIAMVENGRLRR